MHFSSLEQTLWRPWSAIWIKSNKASILPWAWALMGKCRLPQQMSVETCLRHLLFLVIPNAGNSCFHYEGPECPIHSTQKALQSIKSPRPALAMPGWCRQGTPQSESFLSQNEHGTRSGATYLQTQGWHSEASDGPSFRGSRPI